MASDTLRKLTERLNEKSFDDARDCIIILARWLDLRMGGIEKSLEEIKTALAKSEVVGSTDADREAV